MFIGDSFSNKQPYTGISLEILKYLKIYFSYMCRPSQMHRWSSCLLTFVNTSKITCQYRLDIGTYFKYTCMSKWKQIHVLTYASTCLDNETFMQSNLLTYWQEGPRPGPCDNSYLQYSDPFH